MSAGLTLSSRLKGVLESSTLKMNALARELAAKGKKVINLTAGEPDFPVLEPVKDEAIAAIRADFSKYTQVSGIPELRKGISAKFKRDNGLEYAQDAVLVSCGAKQSIFNFLLAAVSPGDEVIILAPYWVSYPEMVKLAGGVPVILDAPQSAGFKITPVQLQKALTRKTKVLVLNSPSNPTGAVYTREEQAALARVLEEAARSGGPGVWVVSDEIYEKLVYGVEFASFASLSEDAFRRTLTVNGFSKAYAMTGWRLGYAAGPRDLIAAMTLVQGQSTSGAASIVQKAAVKALEIPDNELAPMVEAFRRRRDRMSEIFSRCNKCSFVEPQGAFYLFLNVERFAGRTYNKDGKPEVLRGSEDLAFYLLDRSQVVTVAGAGFGADGYLRISFAMSDADVEEGANRIVKALDSLG
ncbi:MAG: pyridoxal phosphate-dependent aminotransferase [Deltaproteobacteria bacterium]|nr:pyridoxal phosphate-dependent aminotransferase [Deltaproteobacteria bacterium]